MGIGVIPTDGKYKLTVGSTDPNSYHGHSSIGYHGHHRIPINPRDIKCIPVAGYETWTYKPSQHTSLISNVVGYVEPTYNSANSAPGYAAKAYWECDIPVGYHVDKMRIAGYYKQGGDMHLVGPTAPIRIDASLTSLSLTGDGDNPSPTCTSYGSTAIASSSAHSTANSTFRPSGGWYGATNGGGNDQFDLQGDYSGLLGHPAYDHSYTRLTINFRNVPNCKSYPNSKVHKFRIYGGFVTLKKIT